MAASATFALKAGVWFRRGRLVMVSPDSLGTACPLSGRNSTYRPVQISETSSQIAQRLVSIDCLHLTAMLGNDRFHFLIRGKPPFPRGLEATVDAFELLQRRVICPAPEAGFDF